MLASEKQGDRTQFTKELQQFLEKYGFRDGIKRLLGWELVGDSIKGQFVGEVGGNLSLLDFTVNKNGIKYGLAKEQKSDAYYQGVLLAFRLFDRAGEVKTDAYNYGRLSIRADKKKRCSTGISCGDTCIEKGLDCDVKTPEAKRLGAIAVEQAKNFSVSPQNIKTAVGIAAVLSSVFLLSSKKKPPTPTISSMGSPKRTTHEAELKIKDLPYEVGVVVHPKTGEVLVQKGGDTSTVQFDNDELKLMKGAIITHNHPDMGCPPGHPVWSGSTFSKNDLALACAQQVGEVRAVGHTEVFSLKPPRGGWNTRFLVQKALPTYDKHMSRLYLSYVEDVRSGKTNALGANVEYHHRVMEATAKELGMEYKREKIPGVNEAELVKKYRQQKMSNNFKKLAQLGLLAVGAGTLASKGGV